MSPTKNTKSAKVDLRKLADVVQREVDAGANTVEEIHRSIAAMPLDVLAKLDVCEATVKDVRKVQETSIGAIYDLIHKVNHEVGKLAKELLDGRARSKPRAAAKKVAAPKKRSSRAPAAHVTRIQPRA